MNLKNLYDIISEQSKKEIDALIKEATEKADEIEKNLTTQFQEKQDERLEKVTLHNKTAISQKRSEVNFKLNQVKGTTQREVLDALFLDALRVINEYSGDMLLDFVCLLIKKSDRTGNEMLAVNKKDYDKYLKALSSNPKSEQVILDKLNKKIGENASHKLSISNALIKDGFLLVGNEYDLSFEFSSIINRLQEEKEKTISEILFDEKS